MKISVIVPAYNAQKSISRLIESLLSQTLKEFEILLIDDGSTDGTAGICDEYASKHTQLPTIKVFHKKNEGVAMARQLGIDNACGEYSIHADTDDWVEPTMLEEMYNKAVEENADVVICDFYANDGNMENYIKQQPDALDHISILHGLFQQLHGSCCNKLVKRVCYNTHGIKFPAGINHCEDLLTWIQLYQHPIKTAYLPKAFYHYVVNENSITHDFTRRTYEMRRAFYRELCKTITMKGFEPDKRKMRLGVLIEGYMYKVISNKDAWTELLKYDKRAAFCETHSPRWLFGYLCLAIGIFPIAKRILKY